jgi:hypothetical protein
MNHQIQQVSTMYYPSFRLEKLRKTTKVSARIVGNPAEIVAGYLPNASVQRCQPPRYPPPQLLNNLLTDNSFTLLWGHSVSFHKIRNHSKFFVTSQLDKNLWETLWTLSWDPNRQLGLRCGRVIIRMNFKDQQIFMGVLFGVYVFFLSVFLAVP